jgi:hypothetical protein
MVYNSPHRCGHPKQECCGMRPLLVKPDDGGSFVQAKCMACGKSFYLSESDFLQAVQNNIIRCSKCVPKCNAWIKGNEKSRLV